MKNQKMNARRRNIYDGLRNKMLFMLYCIIYTNVNFIPKY